MSDTLREQLKDADMMLDIAGYLLTSPVRKAVKDAITELDRLEAEVKRLVPSATTEPVQAAGDSLRRLHCQLYGSCPKCGADAADLHREMHNGQLIAFYVCENDHRYKFSDAVFAAPAEMPNQGQGSQTPMNTETCPHGCIIADGAWCTECRAAEKPEDAGVPVCEDEGCDLDYFHPAHRRAGDAVATAEKPKPVSLEAAFKIKFGVSLSEWMTGGYIPPGVEVVGWIIRTLDQERGV